MSNKKQVKKIFEIDFLGSQKKISPEEREKIIKETADIIKAHKEATAARRAKKAS